MRKIKRFTINESGFMLSPEEMRRINGGSNLGCSSEVCYVYDAETDEFIDKGYCGGGYYEGYAVCACITPSGSWPGGGACDNNQ